MRSYKIKSMVKCITWSVACSTLFANTSVHAQGVTPYAKINAATAASPVIPIPVRGGVTLLDGAGGNVAVFANKNSLLLVDAGIAVSRQKMEAALNAIRPGRIAFLINTHWHWDHTDGNSWAKEDGATIVAHPNTAHHLADTITVVEWGHTFLPVPARDRPSQLVAKSRSIKLGAETVDIEAYMPSHTNGDLSVYFRAADVLVTGDTWWNGMYPFIDYVAGGSINGMIAAANKNLLLAKADTKVIPGHGPVGGAADLSEYRDMLVAIRDRVAQLKSQGMTLDQITAAKPTAEFDRKWGTGIITPELFTALVFKGV